MKFEKNELRVAMFILLPIAFLLLFLILKLGYSFAGSTYDILLKVDNISSIKKGTQVKIKGYTVGRVVEIIPVHQPALHFLAVMRISREVALYDNCSAVIQNQNIIGDPIVELKNPETIGVPLAENDVIEGIEFVNLEVVLQDLHALLNTVSGTVSVIKDISSESKGNLRNLLGNLASTAGTFSRLVDNSQKDILETLSTFRKTAKTMDEISAELKKHPVKFLFK
jgi:ABC-type transporter Mla subunit MlaD